MTALSCAKLVPPLLNTCQLCSLKRGPGEECYWHPGEFVRKAESEIYRIRIYIFHKSVWLISMHDEGPFSSQTTPTAWILSHLCTNSSNKQLRSIWNICWLIQSQGKPLQSSVLFFKLIIDVAPNALNSCQQLLLKRLIVLKKFIFSLDPFLGCHKQTGVN